MRNPIPTWFLGDNSSHDRKNAWIVPTVSPASASGAEPAAPGGLSSWGRGACFWFVVAGKEALPMERDKGVSPMASGLAVLLSHLRCRFQKLN